MFRKPLLPESPAAVVILLLAELLSISWLTGAHGDSHARKDDHQVATSAIPGLEAVELQRRRSC